MAQGDVTVQLVDATTSAVDIAVTAMRVTANDKWLMSDLDDQLIVVNIEEA